MFLFFRRFLKFPLNVASCSFETLIFLSQARATSRNPVGRIVPEWFWLACQSFSPRSHTSNSGGARFGAVPLCFFVAFVAYCLQVTLKQRLRCVAPGLTPRAALEKFAGMQAVCPVAARQPPT